MFNGADIGPRNNDSGNNNNNNTQPINLEVKLDTDVIAKAIYGPLNKEASRLGNSLTNYSNVFTTGSAILGGG